MQVKRKANGWFVKVEHSLLSDDHDDIGPFATKDDADMTATTLQGIVHDAERNGASNYAQSDYS